MQNDVSFWGREQGNSGTGTETGKPTSLTQLGHQSSG